jgi:hypothetical protein
MFLSGLHGKYGGSPRVHVEEEKCANENKKKSPNSIFDKYTSLTGKNTGIGYLSTKRIYTVHICYLQEELPACIKNITLYFLFTDRRM